MKNLDPMHTTAYLRNADLGFVERFHKKARAKLDSIDLGSLGVNGLNADHAFLPYQCVLPPSSVGGDERGIMAWIDEVSAPLPDDRPNVRQAKLRDIDKLGRLAAVAAIRVVVEAPAAEPTLSELASQESAAKVFEEQVEEQIETEADGVGGGAGAEGNPVAEAGPPSSEPTPAPVGSKEADSQASAADLKPSPADSQDGKLSFS